MAHCVFKRRMTKCVCVCVFLVLFRPHDGHFSFLTNHTYEYVEYHVYVYCILHTGRLSTCRTHLKRFVSLSYTDFKMNYCFK